MRKLKLLFTLLISLLAAQIHAQNVNNLTRNVPEGGVLSSGMLPNLVAYTSGGEKISLRDLCKDKYTLIVTGCLTCPEFRRAHPTIEAIAADYKRKGVQFYFVYKTLRHPELEGYVEAQKISERLIMVEHAKKKLGGEIEWIVDEMDNNIATALRAGSRSGYLISPKGEIINAWGSPQEQAMRSALTRVVGAPSKVTRVEELNLPAFERVARTKNIDSDISIMRTDGLTILKTTPQNPDDTYYVKMRAEADESLMSTGKGRMALGFFPDPVYDAHWNNLTPAMKYVLELPEGVTASPHEATAKPGKGDSDSEPRQFWVDIKGAKPGDVMKITYHYYACAPGMCEAFSHTYTIELTQEQKGARTYGFNRAGRMNSGNARSGNNTQRQRSSGQYQQNQRSNQRSRY
ncbi:MAG: hypothetical protein R3Y38_02690 [Rikenellaceae bacterium]